MLEDVIPLIRGVNTALFFLLSCIDKIVVLVVTLLKS